MTLTYSLKLLSDWHIGAGLDAATDANALVLKDEHDLPYLPGKTIKGLFRDAVQDMMDVGKYNKDILDTLFGQDNTYRSEESIYFNNAELEETEQNEIKSHNLSAYLYRNIASTRIEKNGIAAEGSLRVSQVCMPVNLEGSIELEGFNAEQAERLKKALKEAAHFIRHLGVNRNRGLGRCICRIIENK